MTGVSNDNDHETEFLPEIFCWTKFGTEAGESAGSIFRRKEAERRRNDGLFLWGIGHSIRPSLLELLRLTTAPRLVFSPMKSRASTRDSKPSDVMVWSHGVGYDGRPYELPRHSLVTSRRISGNDRQSHFALVCSSEGPITSQADSATTLPLGELRNLVSGAQLGPSQVTSVVRRLRADKRSGVEYPIAAQVRLVYPYLIRLHHGAAIPRSLRLHSADDAAQDGLVEELLRLRAGRPESA